MPGDDMDVRVACQVIGLMSLAAASVGTAAEELRVLPDRIGGVAREETEQYLGNQWYVNLVHAVLRTYDLRDLLACVPPQRLTIRDPVDCWNQPLAAESRPTSLYRK